MGALLAIRRVPASRGWAGLLLWAAFVFAAYQFVGTYFVTEKVSIEAEERGPLGPDSYDTVLVPRSEQQQRVVEREVVRLQGEMKGLEKTYLAYVRQLRYDPRYLREAPRRTPHQLECRPHEPGLVEVENYKAIRGYCFGATAIKGRRVCDTRVPDYRKVEGGQVQGTMTYGVRTLYNRTFAYVPYYHRRRIQQSGGGPEVAVTSQGTWNRNHHLVNLATIWKGPVSFALLLDTPSKLQEVDALLESSKPVADHVDIHVVWRLDHSADSPGAFYPINMLRNIALQTVDTLWVFVLDVDVVPNAPMWVYVDWVTEAARSVTQALFDAKQQLVCPELEAYVPPAVEMSADSLASLYTRAKSSDTLSKALVSECLLRGDARPMHPYFGPAYLPTNHLEWVNSSDVVELPYLTRFEPYYIARMPVPLFNETFVNRGGNYAQQVYEMAAGGYHFFRLPEAFVVDIPHSKKPAPPNNGTANVLDNATKQATHDMDHVVKMWEAQYDHVRTRYGVNMPTASIHERNFRKYRRGLEGVYMDIYRTLRTGQTKSQ